MAKICIFNTQVDTDTAQEPFESVVPEETLPPGLTKPVRLMNTDICSFEFIYTRGLIIAPPGDGDPPPPGPKQLRLRWWREFWGDDVPGSLQNPPPSVRVLAAVPPTMSWSREVGHETTILLDELRPDLVDNLAITRLSILDIGVGELGAGLWVTTKCHAPWVRLALIADTPGLDGGHLLINAHVGGHAEVKELDLKGDVPYAYKFVGTQT